MNSELNEVEVEEYDSKCKILYGDLAAEIQPIFEQNGWKWGFVDQRSMRYWRHTIPNVSQVARVIGDLHRDVSNIQSETGRLFARRSITPIEIGYKRGKAFVVVATL